MSELISSCFVTVVALMRWDQNSRVRMRFYAASRESPPNDITIGPLYDASSVERVAVVGSQVRWQAVEKYLYQEEKPSLCKSGKTLRALLGDGGGKPRDESRRLPSPVRTMRKAEGLMSR